jgi:glycosyltransferase involved in cell wall biosynthesis
MITVLTPSLPERYCMLTECRKSVSHQTMKAFDHIIAIDQQRKGEADTLNTLLRESKTEWIAFLNDDDLFLPHHLERLWAEHDECDVIYSDCEMQGACKSWTSQDFDLFSLRVKNYIPTTVLTKKSTLLSVNGFRKAVYPNWDMWLRLGELGAKFKFIPEITWIYRIHSGSRSAPK